MERPPPPTKKVFERLIHILFIIKYYFIHFQSVYRIGIELLFLLCFMALIISLVYQFLVVALLFKFWPAVELVSRWFPVCVFFWRQKKKSRKHYFHVRYEVSAVAASFKIVGKSWICDNRQLIVNWDAFKSLHNMMKVCLILKSIPILICVKIEKWLFKIFDIWDVFVLKPKRICFIWIIWKWTV